MMRLQSFRKIIFDIVVIAFISLIPLFWFPNGYIVTGHDAGYPINIQETFRNRLFTWNSQQNFGIDNTPNVGAVPIHAIEAVFYVMGASPAQAQQFSFMFWLFLMMASMYTLAYSFQRDIPYRFFPLIASVLYVVNFFLLALWRYGAATTFSAYCALPIILALVIAALQNRIPVLKAGIAISFAAMVFNGGGGLSLPLFGALLISVLSAIVYFAALEGKNGWKVIVWKTMYLGLCIILLSAILNAYWLFPFIHYATSNFARGLEANGGAAGVLAWTDSVSKYTSLINLFRLQGIPEWYDNAVHPFSNAYLTNPLLIGASFLFAPLAYASLLFANEIRQKQLILYFVLLSLIAAFFSAGTHAPTGWLFAQFMLHVPGFVIFRSAQYKFVPALYLSFAILISFSLNYLIYKTPVWEKFKAISPRLLRTSAVFICILVVLGYHWPYFRTEFFQYSPPLTTLLKVPDYVLAYDEWIDDHLDDDKRTLILPLYNSSWKAAVYSWKYFSLYSLFNIIRPKPFLEHSQMLSGSQLALMERFSHEILHQGPLARQFAEFLGVRYILLTGDVDFSLRGMLTENPADYKKALSNYPVLWTNGPWQLYEAPSVTDTKPLYYIKSLTQYIGREPDITGVVINGANNFFHQYDKSHPMAVAISRDIPISNTIEALLCDSCVMETAVNKIEVPHSLILPGSIFYTLKQWKEKPLEHESLPESQLIINKLGLSLKRVSDIASLVQLNKSERSIMVTADTLMAYWKYIEEKVTTGENSEPDYSLLHRIEGYVLSEKEVLLKAYGESKSGGVRQRLISVINKLTQIEVAIVGVRNKTSILKQYRVSQVAQNAEFFLDADSLSKDVNQSYIYPMAMEFNGKSLGITPVAENERVSLGTFDLRGVDRITLRFPQPANVLINRRVESVVAFGTTNFCIVGEAGNFNRNKSYRIHMPDPSGTPEGAAIHVVRKKNSVTKDEGTSINYFTNPDVTFSINRTATVPQNYYFSGIDGDIGVTVYYCASTQMTQAGEREDISLEEIAAPSLFISAHEQYASNARVENASYTRVDQTKYYVESNQEAWPTILVFNQNYDRKWKLYDIQGDNGLNSYLPAIMETWFQKPIVESDHFAVNGYANAWLLRSEPSGRLVLEYYPQQLLYKGIVVTIASFVILISVYMTNGKRDKRESLTQIGAV